MPTIRVELMEGRTPEQKKKLVKALTEAVVTTLGGSPEAVLAAAALLGWLASDLPVEARVMQLVFVGLAALTLPHMVLLERARLAALPTDRKAPSCPEPKPGLPTP